MSKFSPKKLSVEFTEGVTALSPIIPRCYTLIHSDITGELSLTIGAKYAYDKMNYRRDEVLGEWAKRRKNYFFYVNLYIDGKLGPSVTVVRNKFFRHELPLALQAIRFGDKRFFNTHKEIDNAPIFVYFNSINPYFDRIENWGTFSHYDINRYINVSQTNP